MFPRLPKTHIMKALIVNANPLEAKLMGDNLAQEGFRSVFAATGMEAWQTLKKLNDIRVIVVDEHIRDLSYKELLDKLLKDEILRDVPVILLEEARDLKEFNQTRPAGAYFVLTKPVERVLLSSVIHSALNTQDHRESSLGSW